jgi:hypothetical protein
MKRPPTDFKLLQEIFERHRGEFESYSDAMKTRSSKIMVPIDIPGIADHFGVDRDSIFGRLYYHLEPKYGEPVVPDRPMKVFFAPVSGTDQNCVNFPLLEAVLAGLWQERRRDLWALGTALFSLGVALASLLVAILS